MTRSRRSTGRPRGGGGRISICILSRGGRTSAGPLVRAAAPARSGRTARASASPMIGRTTCAAVFVCVAAAAAPLQDPAAGPLLVVDTSKGTFVVETYPVDAPRTVAHIVDLAKRRFYDGQRFHRAIPGFLIQ